MLGLLTRNPDQSIETTGQLIIGQLNLFTLELPWKNNAPDVSCIPSGTYTVQKINTPALGNHFAIENVPGRDLIRIHSANFIGQLLGCIAVGQQGATLASGDGLIDAEHSRAALKQLWDETPDTWTLTVR